VDLHIAHPAALLLFSPVWLTFIRTDTAYTITVAFLAGTYFDHSLGSAIESPPSLDDVEGFCHTAVDAALPPQTIPYKLVYKSPLCGPCETNDPL
jgi:hypothetical protein